MAQSRWIALGETTVDPLDPELGELAFLFDGTLAGDGSLRTTAGIIDDLAPLLTTPNLELDSNDASNRTALVDVSGLGGDDQIYLRNPRLLREFLLVVGDARFTLSEARYLAGTEELALVVSSDGPSLAEASGSVELRPRYFGVTPERVPQGAPAALQKAIIAESIALLPPFARSMLDLERPGLAAIPARAAAWGAARTLRWAFRQG